MASIGNIYIYIILTLSFDRSDANQDLVEAEPRSLAVMLLAAYWYAGYVCFLSTIGQNSTWKTALAHVPVPDDAQVPH